MKESGIYSITCVPTGKIYVGSAVNIGARWRCHRFDLKNNRHHSRYLQRAWRKYGEGSFVWAIIELCQPSDLLTREQFHIDSRKTVKPNGFNMQPNARSSLGLKRTPKQIEAMRARATGKSPSAETRAKQSAIMKIACIGKQVPQWMRDRAKAFNTGRKLSPEHGKKIGDALRGRKRSPETILKCSIAIKKSWVQRRINFPPKQKQQ